MMECKNILKFKSSAKDEIYNYLGTGGESFINGLDVINHYNKNLLHYFSFLFNNDRGKLSKSKILLVGSTNARELSKVLEEKNLLCFGDLRDAFRSHQLGFSFFSDYYFKVGLYHCWINDDLQKIEELTATAANFLMKKNISKVVVSTDSLPLERLIIYAARSLGIETFCFQHGLFSAKIPDINDGRYSDSILCYDDYQYDILISSGARNPISIGYPFVASTESKCQDRKTVLFFGQPWSRYYNNKLESYIRIVEGVKKICDEAGITFFYKPHPCEDLQVNKLVKNILLFKGDLQSALDKHFVFCSISSTALLEASLAGKIVFQVYDKDFISELYEDFGYCYSISVSDKFKFIDRIEYGMPLKIQTKYTRSEKINQILGS